MAAEDTIADLVEGGFLVLADSTFPDVIETWRNAMEALDAQRSELAEAGATGMLAFGLDRIRELRRQLGDLERAVELDVATLMAGKTETIDGLGTLERRRGTDRKAWQSDDLLDLIIRQEVSATEGEDESVFIGHLRDAIRSCIPITPSLGWRVTALRARGIDVDEWCESKPGRTAVQIHKADAA